MPLKTEKFAEISDFKGDNHLANHIQFLSWEPLQKHIRVFRLAPSAECLSFTMMMMRKHSLTQYGCFFFVFFTVYMLSEFSLCLLKI